jgi:hypothetical protein
LKLKDNPIQKLNVMKNIHVLQKNIFNQLGVDHYGKTPTQIKIAEFLINKNIYITSNEEIKEGVNQWYLDKFLNKPRNSSGSQYGEKQNVITLTTDQDLIKDGVQSIDDEFLEWFVKNPSCEYVHVYKEHKQINQDNIVTKGSTALVFSHYVIYIPKEELQDVFFTNKSESSKVERMYSEEEVKQIIDATLIEYSDFVLADIPHWFEQFKKK